MAKAQSLILFICICVITVGYAQPKPTAAFDFNFGSLEDIVNHRPIKISSVQQTTDRFGNTNSALFFSGNEYSYANLGNYAELKPKQGSISLWVKIEHKIASGTGPLYNPIIITKNTSADDFYESYAIYYMLESGRLIAVNAQNETRDLGLYTNETFSRQIWHHVVMCYNFEKTWLYIDGKLESETVKAFDTEFLATDSVMLGVTANKKNSRWFNGCIDDVRFYNSVLSAEDVTALYQAPDPNKQRVLIRTGLLVALALILLFALYKLVTYYIKRSIKKEREKLELSNKLLEYELRINKALMNPHFVFNALNAIYGQIYKEDYKMAGAYLLKVSRFIRKLLEYNSGETILLSSEIDMLKGYIEIEALRFKDEITTVIDVAADIEIEHSEIPAMMLQPLVENAIWHGFRNKKGFKQLKLTFTREAENSIRCVVEDNGCGRKEINRKKHVHSKSMALTFIQQRIELLNKIHRQNGYIEFYDKPNNEGLIVTLVLPLITNKK